MNECYNHRHWSEKSEWGKRHRLITTKKKMTYCIPKVSPKVIAKLQLFIIFYRKGKQILTNFSGFASFFLFEQKKKRKK